MTDGVQVRFYLPRLPDESLERLRGILRDRVLHQAREFAE